MEFKIPEIKDPIKALQIIMLICVAPLIVYALIYNGSKKQAKESYERELESSISGKVRRKDPVFGNRGFELHLDSYRKYGVSNKMSDVIEVGDSIYKLPKQDSLYVKKIDGSIVAFDVVGQYRVRLDENKYF